MNSINKNKFNHFKSLRQISQRIMIIYKQKIKIKFNKINNKITKLKIKKKYKIKVFRKQKIINLN